METVPRRRSCYFNVWLQQKASAIGCLQPLTLHENTDSSHFVAALACSIDSTGTRQTYHSERDLRTCQVTWDRTRKPLGTTYEAFVPPLFWDANPVVHYQKQPIHFPSLSSQVLLIRPATPYLFQWSSPSAFSSQAVLLAGRESISSSYGS